MITNAPGMEAYALSEPGRQYAITLQGKPGGFLKLKLPKGRYTLAICKPDTRYLKPDTI